MSGVAITFSAQIGADGEKIAYSVSQRLGLRYYDQEIIDRAAAIAGVSPEVVASAERWPSFLERMMESLAYSAVISEGVLPLTTPPPTLPALVMQSKDYQELIRRVILGLAARGDCVIVGHAAQAILKDFDGPIVKCLVLGSPEKRPGACNANELSQMKRRLRQSRKLIASARTTSGIPMTSTGLTRRFMTLRSMLMTSTVRQPLT